MSTAAIETTIRITQLTKAQRAVILALAGAIEEEKINPEGLEMVELDGFGSNEFHYLTLKFLKRMHVINDYQYHHKGGGTHGVSPFLVIEFQPKRIIDTAAKIKCGKGK
jgi:hypothetical protein